MAVLLTAAMWLPCCTQARRALVTARSPSTHWFATTWLLRSAGLVAPLVDTLNAPKFSAGGAKPGLARIRMPHT